MNEKYILFFLKIQNIGSGTIFKLEEYFENLENAFCASDKDLKAFGFKKEEVEKIKKEKIKYSFEKELEKYEKEKIKIVTYFDNNFPKNLKNIEQPPIIIFYKGELENIKESIGVVGTRKPTEYGISVTKDFVEFFAKNKISIISGGASGIDSISHIAALKNKTRTVAVMGCGLDTYYPSSNKKMFEEIIDNDGVLLSEFPIGIKPIGKNFVIRNRLISGLSDGLLVVEAGEKSGTIITAGFANSQGRNVFVIPGSIYSEYSRGTNKLIKDGAIFVTDPVEICEMIWGDIQIKTFQKDFKKQKEKVVDTDWMNFDQKKIYESISLKGKCIEEIFIETKIDMSIISSALILFEIKGIVKNIGGMRYVKN